MLESVGASDPAVMEDLTNVGVTNGEVQAVLAALLEDGVSIRDLVRIVETISDRARTNRSLDALVAACRETLGPALSSTLAVDGKLDVVTIAPMFESTLAQCLEPTEQGPVLRVPPDLHDHLGHEVRRVVATHVQRPASPVLVCSPGLRSALAQMVGQLPTSMTVLSYQEIGDHLQIELIDTLSDPPLAGLGAPAAPTAVATPHPPSAATTAAGPTTPSSPASVTEGLNDDRLAHTI